VAEAGQTDNNRIFAVSSPKVDKSPEWKEERGRMLSFVVDKLMEQMSVEERDRRARGTINERYLYAPDHELISHYENLGGEWTERMKDQYRA